jgi:hypothetical protein
VDVSDFLEKPKKANQKPLQPFTRLGMVLQEAKQVADLVVSISVLTTK